MDDLSPHREYTKRVCGAGGVVRGSQGAAIVSFFLSRVQSEKLAERRYLPPKEVGGSCGGPSGAGSEFRRG